MQIKRLLMRALGPRQYFLTMVFVSFLSLFLFITISAFLKPTAFNFPSFYNMSTSQPNDYLKIFHTRFLWLFSFCLLFIIAFHWVKTKAVARFNKITATILAFLFLTLCIFTTPEVDTVLYQESKKFLNYIRLLQISALIGFIIGLRYFIFLSLPFFTFAMQVQLTSSLYGGAARSATDWTSMAECGILIVFGTSVIIGFNKLQTKFSIKSIRKYINFDYFNKKYFNAQEAFFLLVVACHMASYFLSSYGKIYGLIGPNYSWLTENPLHLYVPYMETFHRWSSR